MMEEVQKDVVEIQQEIHNALIVEDKELVSAWHPVARSVSVVLLFCVFILFTLLLACAVVFAFPLPFCFATAACFDSVFWLC